ncbi:MAG: hypothetical protein AB8G15_09815 [Saprospiraceae bacterium]
MSIIFEAIAEVVFGGFIKGLFSGIRWVGLVVIKLLSFSKDSLKTLSEKKYKDSSIPYFVGTGCLIALSYSMIAVFF